MNRRQKIIVSVVGIFIVLLALVGITYGYFLTRIQGNTNTTSISVTTADLKLTYGDGNGKIEPTELIMPGFNKTKTFTVTNDGNVPISYSIIFEDVDNNFERVEDWEYVLRKDGETEPVATGIITNHNVQIILSNVEIQQDVTDSYTLEVTYKETNTDQSVDMNKHLSLLVNIVEKSFLDKAEDGTLLHAIRTNNEVKKTTTLPGRTPSGITYNEVDKSPTNLGMDIYVNLSNIDYYITYGTGYTFDEKTGTFELINKKHCKYKECYSELIGNYIESGNGFIYPSPIEQRVANLENISLVTYADLENLQLSPKGIKANLKEEKEAMLSYSLDEDGLSYFFRGEVENNYVTFADKCWRIVRIQGNGGIKLVLADRNNKCEEGYSPETADSAFITNTTEQGFAYKNTLTYTPNDFIYESSDVNKVLQAWLNGGTYNYYDSSEEIATSTFTKQISDENQKLLMDAEWCNDTSVTEKINIDSNGYETDDISTEFYGYIYGANDRLNSRKTATPTYKCNMLGIEGTEATIYRSKIGVLTADELAFAGSVIRPASWTNNNYYLIRNANAHDLQLTPHAYEKYDDYSDLYLNTRNKNGFYRSQLLEDIINYAIRPSVVLKSDVTVSTNPDSEFAPGTYQNPYIIINNQSQN